MPNPNVTSPVFLRHPVYLLFSYTLPQFPSALSTYSMMYRVFRALDLPSDPGSAVVLGDDGTLRKTRSNSFSSSLRRIFRRDKKDISRESSLKNPSSSSGHLGRGGGSREALTAEHGSDRSRRHNTPVPSDDKFATGGGTDFTYSSSVPAATSPLHNR